MNEINPVRAEDVDLESFIKFVDDLKYVVSRLKKRFTGIVMGIDEGSFNKYLSGTSSNHKISNNIISDFYLVFTKMFEVRERALAKKNNTSGMDTDNTDTLPGTNEPIHVEYVGAPKADVKGKLISAVKQLQSAASEFLEGLEENRPKQDPPEN